METSEDKKITEMAKEAHLLRREVAIISAVFFILIIILMLFLAGTLTRIELPY